MKRIPPHWHGFALIVLLFASRIILAADKAHNFAKWEKEIAAFEQADRTNAPSRGAIVFTGSSTIRLWRTLAQDFPDHKVLNRGFGGCEIVDCTHFADRILVPLAPRVVFLRCGGNDLWNGRAPAQVFADFQDFVKAIHAKLPETEIIFIALSPSVARWSAAAKEAELNTLVAGYCKSQPRVKYLDVSGLSLGPDGKPRAELFIADQLHFNAEGYRMLVEKVRPALPQH